MMGQKSMHYEAHTVIPSEVSPGTTPPGETTAVSDLLQPYLPANLIEQYGATPGAAARVHKIAAEKAVELHGSAAASAIIDAVVSETLEEIRIAGIMSRRAEARLEHLKGYHSRTIQPQ